MGRPSALADNVQEQKSGIPSHFKWIECNSGQRDGRSIENIVIPDHRDILRDTHSVLLDGCPGGKSHDIVCREHRREAMTFAQDPLHVLEGFIPDKVALDAQFVANCDPRLAQRFYVPCLAFYRGAGSDPGLR